MYDYDDDDERPTRRQSWYEQDLRRHPDCRDPDHPGCPECNPTDEEGENDN